MYQRDKTTQRRYWREWYYRNWDVEKERRNKARAKLRQTIREIKSRPCADCKQTYPYYVMDFDHREKKISKKHLVSRMAIASGKKALFTEIAKCDVVCSNCHRIRSHTRQKH